MSKATTIASKSETSEMPIRQTIARSGPNEQNTALASLESSLTKIIKLFVVGGRSGLIARNIEVWGNQHHKHCEARYVFQEMQSCCLMPRSVNNNYLCSPLDCRKLGYSHE